MHLGDNYPFRTFFADGQLKNALFLPGSDLDAPGAVIHTVLEDELMSLGREEHELGWKFAKVVLERRMLAVERDTNDRDGPLHEIGQDRVLSRLGCRIQRRRETKHWEPRSFRNDSAYPLACFMSIEPERSRATEQLRAVAQRYNGFEAEAEPPDLSLAFPRLVRAEQGTHALLAER